MSTAERAAKAERCQERQRAIDSDVEKWYQDTLQCATKMSEQYGKPATFFANLLFTHGTSNVSGRKVNAWNAYLHVTSQEVTSEGECLPSCVR